MTDCKTLCKLEGGHFYILKFLEVRSFPFVFSLFGCQTPGESNQNEVDFHQFNNFPCLAFNGSRQIGRLENV